MIYDGTRLDGWRHRADAVQREFEEFEVASD